MNCPDCGTHIDLDDCVYTAINQEVFNPRLMIYSPTCGKCGHKIQDKSEWLFPLLPKGARVLGGLIMYPHFPSKEDTQ